MNKTTLVDLPIERPIRVYQGTHGQSELVTPATPERPWTVRHRRGTPPTVEYNCPDHGRFEIRAEALDVAPCPECQEPARWVPPRVGIGWAAGEVES